MQEDFFFVYILEMCNGSYYTGYAADLKKRYEKHLAGKGARFTRAFKPERIARAWRIYGDKGLAMKVEAFIKKQDRSAKEFLVIKPGALKKTLKAELNLDINIKTCREKF